MMSNDVSMTFFRQNPYKIGKYIILFLDDPIKLTHMVTLSIYV